MCFKYSQRNKEKKSISNEKYSVAEIIKPYVNQNVFAVASWNDPKPIVKRIFDALTISLDYLQISGVYLSFLAKKSSGSHGNKKFLRYTAQPIF